MWIASSFDRVRTPLWAALGNFDGVHLGHCQVIDPVLPPTAPRLAPAGQPRFADPAPPLTQPAGTSDLPARTRPTPSVPSPQPHDRPIPPSHIHSTVITFSPHPQEFFSGQPKALLTPIPEKAHYLSTLGVEQLVLLPFNRELATLSPEAFVEDILVRKLQVRGLSVGQDFCFGAKRSGTAAQLQAIAARHNIPVVITPLQSLNQERISSSAIREALLQGDVVRAAALLGRPYVIQGDVVKGQQLGRTLGFPTANLQLPPHKFVPCNGVYGVWVHNVNEPDRPPMAGVMNIGNRPTIDGQHQTLEVHILDGGVPRSIPGGIPNLRKPHDPDHGRSLSNPPNLPNPPSSPHTVSSRSADPASRAQTLDHTPTDRSASDPDRSPLNLYGQTLAVQLVQFLRSEQKFNSLDDLKAQIATDCTIARALLRANLTTPT